MPSKRRLTPPFSPVLLAGLAARPLPPIALQPGLNLALRTVLRRHPNLFERLSGFGAPSFLIDPVDLPFVFRLEADAEHPSLRALRRRRADEMETTAIIRGPLLKLIDLLEGRIDGDSLFFSRDLVFEGETEAVVALRNAIDDAEIDLIGDLLAPLGPLSGPARVAVDTAGSLFSRAARDLETLRDAILAPALRRTEAQAANLRDLEDKVGAAKPDRRTAQRRRAPSGKPAKA
jgi:O2-independent ubiquinone biosynthesis accessory factor UbiT